jgi:EmrB/QacA subfamily drug resistance transporter
MLYRAYPPEERPRASSITSMVTVLAPAIGPVLGGFLVQKASWRWIFYVNLPVGVFGVIFSVVMLREHKEPTARNFDLAGFALSGAGLAMLLFGLAEGPVRGWSSTEVLLSLVGGAVTGVILVIVELRIDNPMLDLRLLADRSFRTPNIVSFAAYGSLIGVLFLLPQFLQGPRGLSPLQSGLTTFPQAFGVMIMARIVGSKLYPIIGPRRLATLGTLGITGITLLFLLVDLGTSQWWIRLLMFTRGLFLGFVFIPIQAAAFARIPLPSTGRASALFQVQRQVGSAIGVAVLATMLTMRLRAYKAVAPNLSIANAEGWAHAFHQSIVVAGALGFLGVVASLFIKDSDAAPTMRRRAATADH